MAVSSSSFPVYLDVYGSVESLLSDVVTNRPVTVVSKLRDQKPVITYTHGTLDVQKTRGSKLQHLHLVDGTAISSDAISAIYDGRLRLVEKSDTLVSSKGVPFSRVAVRDSSEHQLLGTLVDTLVLLDDLSWYRPLPAGVTLSTWASGDVRYRGIRLLAAEQLAFLIHQHDVELTRQQSGSGQQSGGGVYDPVYAALYDQASAITDSVTDSETPRFLETSKPVRRKLWPTTPTIIFSPVGAIRNALDVGIRQWLLTQFHPYHLIRRYSDLPPSVIEEWLQLATPKDIKKHVELYLDQLINTAPDGVGRLRKPTGSLVAEVDQYNITANDYTKPYFAFDGQVLSHTIKQSELHVDDEHLFSNANSPMAREQFVGRVFSYLHPVDAMPPILVICTHLEMTDRIDGYYSLAVQHPQPVHKLERRMLPSIPPFNPNIAYALGGLGSVLSYRFVVYRLLFLRFFDYIRAWMKQYCPKYVAEIFDDNHYWHLFKVTTGNWTLIYRFIKAMDTVFRTSQVDLGVVQHNEITDTENPLFYSYPDPRTFRFGVMDAESAANLALLEHTPIIADNLPRIPFRHLLAAETLACMYNVRRHLNISLYCQTIARHTVDIYPQHYNEWTAWRIDQWTAHPDGSRGSMGFDDELDDGRKSTPSIGSHMDAARGDVGDAVGDKVGDKVGDDNVRGETLIALPFDNNIRVVYSNGLLL